MHPYYVRQRQVSTVFWHVKSIKASHMLNLSMSNPDIFHMNAKNLFFLMAVLLFPITSFATEYRFVGKVNQVGTGPSTQFRVWYAFKPLDGTTGNLADLSGLKTWWSIGNCRAGAEVMEAEGIAFKQMKYQQNNYLANYIDIPLRKITALFGGNIPDQFKISIHSKMPGSNNSKLCKGLATTKPSGSVTLADENVSIQFSTANSLIEDFYEYDSVSDSVIFQLNPNPFGVTEGQYKLWNAKIKITYNTSAGTSVNYSKTVIAPVNGWSLQLDSLFQSCHQYDAPENSGPFDYMTSNNKSVDIELSDLGSDASGKPLDKKIVRINLRQECTFPSGGFFDPTTEYKLLGIEELTQID